MTSKLLKGSRPIPDKESLNFIQKSIDPSFLYDRNIQSDFLCAYHKWLQNSKVARGKSDITLDLTMTAEDETWYDKYVAKQNIPLIRLDFGSAGSIALTNGTITAFSRPLTPGGEQVDTMSIKFRGAGDYKNYSSFAISSDITLVPS